MEVKHVNKDYHERKRKPKNRKFFLHEKIYLSQYQKVLI